MKKKKIIVLFNNPRGFENVSLVLKYLKPTFKIILLRVGYSFDPSSLDNIDTKFSIINSYQLEDNTYSQEFLDKFFKDNFSLIKGSKAFLISDIQNFPGMSIYDDIKNINPTCQVFAFQHGLYQKWTSDRSKILFDWYFAFGPTFSKFIPGNQRDRVIYGGMPKLDKLKKANLEGEFILFIGQKYPAPRVIDPLLIDLEESFGVPVLVRNHPQYPKHYKLTDFKFDSFDLRDQLSSCRFVVTTHSTVIVEALKMGKRVVILPNVAIGEFEGFKAISRDFTADEVSIALDKYKTWNYKSWLKRSVGDVSRCHSEYIADTIVEKVSKNSTLSKNARVSGSRRQYIILFFNSLKRLVFMKLKIFNLKLNEFLKGK